MCHGGVKGKETGLLIHIYFIIIIININIINSDYKNGNDLLLFLCFLPLGLCLLLFTILTNCVPFEIDNASSWI